MTQETASVTEQRDKRCGGERDSLARAQENPTGLCHGVTVRDVTHRDVTVERDSDTTSSTPRHGQETLSGLHETGHRLFALDPGPSETGWCIFDGASVVDSGVHANHDVLRWVKAGQGCDFLAIEMIANMGMAVGATTFDTVRWIGRFQQAWHSPEAVKLVFRREVKSCICNSQRAKDANIRQALIDLLGAPGTKKHPGPTYGVSSHAWSALAVAVTAFERMGIRVDPKQRALEAA